MIVFDFDGVLINSLTEIAVNAYNVVTNSLHTDINEVDPSFIKLFKHNRHLAHKPEDFVVLAKWCHENAFHGPEQSLSTAKFNEMLEQETVPASQRLKTWFDTRKAFADKDLEAWLKLNYPYQPLWDALIKHGAENIVVLTTKNKNSVLDLSSHYGLNLLAKNVFSGESGITKPANFHAINKAFKQDTYTFIDDSLGNLIEIAENLPAESVQLMLASWGYVGSSDCAEAIKLGFQVCSQEEVISMLGE
ncbi:MAG: hypothetical protein IT292_07510 [Deltaproteobacteria bacterium]|nr:hypothetical protein [Deltaproteobacteria bacterium]